MKYLNLIASSKTFNEIKKEFALNMAKHAYLLECPDAAYGFEFATAAAAVALCKNGGCFTCGSCKSVFSRNHTDFFPVPKSGKMNVKQIGELVAQTYVLGLSGKQAFVIDCTNASRDDWQNKLLKTLEEPESGNFLFLVSTCAAQLKPTIRSRVSLLNVELPSKEQVRSHFLERGYAENVDVAASLCEGKIGYCEELLSSGLLSAVLLTVIGALSKLKTSRDVLTCVGELGQYREQPRLLFSALNFVLSDALLLKTGGEMRLIKLSKYDILKVIDNFSAEALATALEAVSEQFVKIELNFSFAMVLDELILKIAEARNRCRT